MQPANTPYRVERIPDTAASSLRNGYVLKEASGIIVAACPHAYGGPLERCEGTARLLAAGANHLPELARRLRKAEPLLINVLQLQETLDLVYGALCDAEDFCDKLDTDDARKTAAVLHRARRNPVLDKMAQAPAVLNPLLDALEAADRETPQ